MPAANEAQPMLPNVQAPCTDTSIRLASFAKLPKELRQKILANVFDDIFTKIGPTTSENVVAVKLRAVISTNRPVLMDAAQPLRKLYAALEKRHSVLAEEEDRGGRPKDAEDETINEEMRERNLSMSLMLYDDLMTVRLSLKVLEAAVTMVDRAMEPDHDRGIGDDEKVSS